MKNKKALSELEIFIDKLSEEDKTRLFDFYCVFDGHIKLGEKDKALMRADIDAAILYYDSIGLSLDESLKRLSTENLGGFYSRPAALWYPLDDAAKIYPLSMKHGQMAVFRLSAYLTEPVVPALLQLALSFTVKRFPSFATTVKKGFFWHYIDASKRRYVAEPESEIPCSPLHVSKSGSQSFRVLYYENRISVEFFHILTDGTGGTVFLKTLTSEYLRLTGADFTPSEGVPDINEIPPDGETANEFMHAERTEKASGFIDRPAVQLGGRLSRLRPCRNVHFDMNAAELKAAARRYDATVTAYMLALMFVSCRRSVDGSGGSFNIQVPVNMRKFYPSDTLRNFSLYCGIKLPAADITEEPASIVGEITRQLGEKASKAAMSEMLTSTERMVRALRYIPLFIKAPVARIVYGFLGDGIFSNTLSNLGVVTLPAELSGKVKSMDFVLGTALTNRAGCSMVTYGGVATLSISKNTSDPSFEESMYRLLKSDGVGVKARGSMVYEA